MYYGTLNLLKRYNGYDECSVLNRRIEDNYRNKSIEEMMRLGLVENSLNEEITNKELKNYQDDKMKYQKMVYFKDRKNMRFSLFNNKIINNFSNNFNKNFSNKYINSFNNNFNNNLNYINNNNIKNFNNNFNNNFNSNNNNFNQFIDNQNLFYKKLITSIILRFITRGNIEIWFDRFRNVISFLPQTLLLGYILFLRLFGTTLIEEEGDIPDIYLACCISASKYQSDLRISNINFINEEIDIKKMNYLEGWVLNKLEYNLRIENKEMIEIIEYINRL